MKKIVSVLLIMLMLVGCSSEAKEKDLKIGVIQWAEHPALNESLEGMKQGLIELGVIDQVQLDVKNANEDVSNANMIVSQFVNNDVDLIFAIATPAAQTALTHLKKTDIPLVFSAVSDPVVAGLLSNSEKPEGNVTGVSDLPPLQQQVELMLEILPNLKSVGIVFNTSEINGVNQIKEVKKIAEKLNIKIIDKGISSPNEISSAASQLASQTDASFIVNDNMIANAAGLIVDRFAKENKPVFMAESGQFEQGIFAADSVSYFNLGKQAGEMIHDILLNNKDISMIPVQTSKTTELLINEKMAEQLNIEIPESILARAGGR
ncbi:ABC transporter substrate-binding protein [Erysipelothrix urinaevulpis]|uniref:ABC transporter substrate-binding protein n=1 Tax=Erysipelothrix urinaevulpis TaxID=2683717 RepID=UPI00135CE894|nr:ABC transporter substrate-binding protein [Erysipelothrix urinaevulpis]